MFDVINFLHSIYYALNLLNLAVMYTRLRLYKSMNNDTVLNSAMERVSLIVPNCFTVRVITTAVCQPYLFLADCMSNETKA